MVRQSGLSLIEALIALVILAFGLIGVAAMQVTALQSASAGYTQSLANVAAVDAQERIWAALSSYQDCDTIPLATIESAWHSHWFAGQQAALGYAQGQESRIDRQGCRFDVVVRLRTEPNESDDIFNYVFQLPNQP
ncbi:type IV pilus modification PilV family protein [Vreelandella alkaliphila]|uniref:Prepilin-type N-terminal cleavage/methylation domain-containing protein n=1 Tax=Vreelandella alkaliphila TaxID=272774 RepID=A0AAJ2RZX6_9GAMM|nr:prepilin-type N-terminal cleavage/methylation domain-containing protein [Halomonas alkaliphila]MDX5977356.1 prepilin-type N-terminal cleavage/methylation domain-containing protein [Halomonas alkaliphila]